MRYAIAAACRACGALRFDRFSYHYKSRRGATLDFSRPGKPTDNAFIEAFNGRFRQECLNTHRFMSLPDVREKVDAWRRYHNGERPHSAIGNKSPIMLTESGNAASPLSR